jgi:hypothetical protein
MNKSTTHQFLEKITASIPHQQTPQLPTISIDSFPETQELQKTVALLLLFRNNCPHTQWPQTPPQQQPSSPYQLLLQLTPEQETELGEAEGLAALWEEVPYSPPNNKSVTHWPQLLDDLAEEEVEAILQLEEAEAADLRWQRRRWRPSTPECPTNPYHTCSRHQSYGNRPMHL